MDSTCDRAPYAATAALKIAWCPVCGHKKVYPDSGPGPSYWCRCCGARFQIHAPDIVLIARERAAR